MRLLRSGLTNEEQQHSETFAKWLLNVGNSKIGEPDEENDQDSSWITIPPEYSIIPDETGLSQLIDFIYDDATLKTPTAGALQQKAIVCPKNQIADAVNAKILSNAEGQSRIYLSNDEAIPTCIETSETELLYPTEYLNTITFPRFPPYELELKVGSPIMLLQNLNLSGGLCNGTRMIVHFAPSTRKGAGEFVVEDVLDIQTAVATHTAGTGTILATSSATTTKESASKDKCPQGTK
ncbi:DNA helicase [Tanacetum coccineum]